MITGGGRDLKSTPVAFSLKEHPLPVAPRQCLELSVFEPGECPSFWKRRRSVSDPITLALTSAFTYGNVNPAFASREKAKGSSSLLLSLAACRVACLLDGQSSAGEGAESRESPLERSNHGGFCFILTMA